MDEEYLQIAVNILCGEEYLQIGGEEYEGFRCVGLLNNDLTDKLRSISQMCMSQGRQLMSVQVISLIINNWMCENPGKDPYLKPK